MMPAAHGVRNDCFLLLTPHEARIQAKSLDFTKLQLAYILWDVTEPIKGLPAQPIYVGTARGHGRIYNHANKDHGNVKLARKSNAHALADFVEAKVKSHGPGWLRITLRMHPNFAAAQADERFLINRWGIRTDGGLLFNRCYTG